MKKKKKRNLVNLMDRSLSCFVSFVFTTSSGTFDLVSDRWRDNPRTRTASKYISDDAHSPFFLFCLPSGQK
jgi:hypothetical protein